MLLSLHILLDTLAPAENAPAVRSPACGRSPSDPVLCVLIARGADLGRAFERAVVLLVMSLAYSHFVTPVAALALVLGANLGSAINPVLEGSQPRQSGEPPPAARQSAQPAGRLRCWCCRSCTPIADCSAGSSRTRRARRRISTPRSTSALAVVFILPLDAHGVRC